MLKHCKDNVSNNDDYNNKKILFTLFHSASLGADIQFFLSPPFPP